MWRFFQQVNTHQACCQPLPDSSEESWSIYGCHGSWTIFFHISYLQWWRQWQRHHSGTKGELSPITIFLPHPFIPLHNYKCVKINQIWWFQHKDGKKGKYLYALEAIFHFPPNIFVAPFPSLKNWCLCCHRKVVRFGCQNIQVICKNMEPPLWNPDCWHLCFTFEWLRLNSY